MFATVGVLSTLAYVTVFVLLHNSLGSQTATVLALAATAIGTTRSTT